MIKENYYSKDAMKKYFNKKLVMTKRDNEDFENFTNCLIWENDNIDNEC